MGVFCCKRLRAEVTDGGRAGRACVGGPSELAAG